MGLRPITQQWGRDDVGERRAAVLVAVTSTTDPEVLVTVRSPHLAHHPGQVAFPGGGVEMGDENPAATALREAREEVGLAPDRVSLVGELAWRTVRVSGNRVVPVVGLWDGESPLGVRDPAEVDRILRWRLRDLSDPRNRLLARHPGGGTGPAWWMGDVFLWGLSAGVIDELLTLSGWGQPWDASRVVDVPPAFLRERPQPR